MKSTLPMKLKKKNIIKGNCSIIAKKKNTEPFDYYFFLNSQMICKIANKGIINNKCESGVEKGEQAQTQIVAQTTQRIIEGSGIKKIETQVDVLSLCDFFLLQFFCNFLSQFVYPQLNITQPTKNLLINIYKPLLLKSEQSLE